MSTLSKPKFGRSTVIAAILVLAAAAAAYFLRPPAKDPAASTPMTEIRP